MTVRPDEIKPSRKWYVLALLITLLGPIIGVISIINIMNQPLTRSPSDQQEISATYTVIEKNSEDNLIIEKIREYPMVQWFDQHSFQSIKINLILIFLALLVGPLLAIGILIARNSAIGDEPVSVITPENASANNALAAFCHGSGFTFFLYPFGNIISPLFIWLFFKDQYPAVNEHGKSVLNFQLSMSIYYLLVIPLVFLIIGIPILILLFLYHLFIMFIGVAMAAQGKSFRYPLSLRLIT